ATATPVWPERTKRRLRSILTESRSIHGQMSATIRKQSAAFVGYIAGESRRRHRHTAFAEHAHSTPYIVVAFDIGGCLVVLDDAPADEGGRSTGSIDTDAARGQSIVLRNRTVIQMQIGTLPHLDPPTLPRSTGVVTV